jgi:hypothetical protein
MDKDRMVTLVTYFLEKIKKSKKNLEIRAPGGVGN